MSNTPNKKLDSYFVNFISDPKFTNFMNGFFGQEKVWVKNALKAVLPENTSEEVLNLAAERLFKYKNENTLHATPSNIDEFFRDFYDK